MKRILWFVAWLMMMTPGFAEEQSFVEFTSSYKTVDVARAGLDHPVWAEVEAAKHPMQPQFLVLPKPKEVGVKEVGLQSIHDGTNIAFLLTWKDETEDSQLNITNFSDAAALQFPVKKDPLPKYFMGEEGKPVHIIYWKAWRSRDKKDGFQTVQSAYPNMTSDIYNFDYKIEGIGTPKTDEEKNIFIPGRAAKNPLSFPHKEIVEELTSQGPGTLSSLNIENTKGLAEWKDGVWTVLFVRPLYVNDTLSVRLKSGEKMPIAIAVWEGSRLESGGRKAVSAAWAEIKVE
jgi:hypothetical protein